MSKIVAHFNFKGDLHTIVLDTSAKETSLLMIKARIYRKLALDEMKVKLQLSYVPLLVGCEKELVITDDEDVRGYLMSINKDMRRCELKVKGIPILEPSEQLSRVGKSDFGTNYDDVDQPEEEVEGNAIVLYIGEERSKRPNDAIDECYYQTKEGANTNGDGCEDNNIGGSDMYKQHKEERYTTTSWRTTSVDVKQKVNKTKTTLVDIWRLY